MPFEPINPPQFPSPIAPFSAGAKAGNTVYASGTLALGEGGVVLHVGDAAAQTRHVLETIKITLEAAGAKLSDVAFNHIFLKDWGRLCGHERRLRRVFPRRQARPLLHPVRAGEAGLPGGDRQRRAPVTAQVASPVKISGLYCEVLGPADGAPVILSAGLGGIAEYWRPNLAALDGALPCNPLRPSRHSPQRPRPAAGAQHRSDGRRRAGRAGWA